MPVLSGARTTRILRERGFTGFVIGMTGDPHGCEDRDEFEASGLDLCVDKAVEGMDTLADIIASGKMPGAAFEAKAKTASDASVTGRFRVAASGSAENN